MADEQMTLDKSKERFLALLRRGATAVPKGEAEATAWAGDGIRLIGYAERERVGNALLAAGVLRFGEPVFGSNSVKIERCGYDD